MPGDMGMPSSILSHTLGLIAQSSTLLEKLSPQVTTIEIYRWPAIHERTILTRKICSHPKMEVLL